MPDQGDGTYRNPVLFADYSDPDAIRVGQDYYLVSSSFNCAPGLPVLRSKDLVNWRIINHALPRLVPEEIFRVPQHGKGVWAPALRHHDGRFWVYYPDPDHGIFLTTAADPAGAWSPPVQVLAGRGLIDPCPLWDDDGKVYLVHAWAKSRAGFNNVLTLVRLSDDGTRAADAGRVIIDGNKLPGYRTLEGPKLYKRDGWYYVFAPAGGVKEGWQSAFRARDINGPYEDRIVLEQGHTDINGPHQGAWVDTPDGVDWFLHFQDLGAYGRVVHLQPMQWRDGWPVIGRAGDGDGRGEPVRTWRKPDSGPAAPRSAPQTSDEFDGPALGTQWQWPANPQPGWFSLTERPGALRLRVQKATGTNLWTEPALLLQKLAAPEFVATTRMTFSPAAPGEKAGLLVSGDDYAWIGLKKTETGWRVVQVVCRGAAKSGSEQEIAGLRVNSPTIVLRVVVTAGASCRFSYSEDGQKFMPLGDAFVARPELWIGAKVGLFALATGKATQTGCADFDWFRVECVPP